MSDKTTANTPPAPSADTVRPAPRSKYEPPSLVDYGDIATLTQTGGLTTKDTGTKKRRIG